jgi:quercetin dioxygenase-like cupin family protein
MVAILTWEEVMPKLVGFSRFAALLEEQIGEKISRRILSGDQGMIVWWSIGAGVHVETHSHANEQIVWMLKGKMEFRLGSEQRVCGRGDVVVIPGGTEHEAWFREDTEVIDFFAPPRDDFLLGGRPAYISEGLNRPAAAAGLARRQIPVDALILSRGPNPVRWRRCRSKEQ